LTRASHSQTKGLAQAKPIAVTVPQPSTVPPPTPQTLVVDFKNIPIESFNISMDAIMELAKIFSEASNKIRELEEQALIERYPSGPQRQMQIASIPSPSIEVYGDDGRYMFFPAQEFDLSKVSPNLKAVHFSSYKQGGYFPTYGLQIHINNLNGVDPQNLIGVINVHGSDSTWVMGIFESVKQFFTKNKTRRAWLHQQITGHLVLYGLVFPLALWALFRIIGVLPIGYGNLPLIQFGLFVYLFGGCYLAFNKLLVYLRWTLPLYEIQGGAPNKRKKHRFVAFTIFIGIVSAVLWDFFKFILMGTP
jgi:hypothetical protein